VDIPLDTFDKARVVRTMPSALNRFLQWPKRGRNVLGAFSRKSVPSSTHFVLQTLQVTEGAWPMGCTRLACRPAEATLWQAAAATTTWRCSGATP